MATKPIFDDVPAWPGENVSAPAPRDHNKPPLDELIPLEFREKLTEDRPDFLQKVADLVDAAERAKAEDDDTLGRCGDLVKAYRAAIGHIEAKHKEMKQPFLDGGRLVDAERKMLIGPVEDAKRKVEGIANTYVARKDAEARAERARIEAEQRAAAEAAAKAEREREEVERAAERAALAAATADERAAADAHAAEAARKAEEAMAAAALAPAIPDKPEPICSDAGATVSGKREWKAEVTDYEIAFIAVADDENVRAAIDKAIARRVRAGSRKIDGVRIWPVAKANFT
ncbi:MAG: hypothetical protein KGM49_09390 [Sphingomonadales bacterium]|nr:hypothetical protein [Sphingomonadales bacterium]